jgi:rhodanese-related sulfurtransferase
MTELTQFVGNHPFLFMALFVVLAMIIKLELDNRVSGVQHVKALDAVRLMNNEDMLILDVRESAEFNTGHIRSAMHIPVGALKKRMTEIEKYKGRPVLAYCHSGGRSSHACRVLKKAGFEKLHNLSGGLIGWNSANLPLTKK